jgi:hypothetical protein
MCARAALQPRAPWLGGLLRMSPRKARKVTDRELVCLPSEWD